MAPDPLEGPEGLLDGDGEATGAGAAGAGARNGRRKPRTNEEAEAFRKRVFDLRMRGMMPGQIASMVGESVALVQHHIRKARMERLEEVEFGGKKEKVGEGIRMYQALREEAMRQMHKAEEGSAVRAVWFAEARKCVDKELEFLMEVGFLPRASEKLEVLVRDARGMSLAEINAEIGAIERRLANASVIPDARGGREAQKLAITLNGHQPERVIDVGGVKVKEAEPFDP